MMRPLLLFMLATTVLPAHAADFWSALWRNADQQGEALLQQGDAGTAAKVYADPRRKAYAKLKAGDYAGAAQDLGDLHDSDDDYNRGNALAHAGNLQGALEAYDAALKSKPDNQDARHNRELVQNALKQQQQQNSGDSKSQDEKKDGQQGKDQNATGQNSSNQGEQNKQGDQSGKENKGQQDKSGKGQDSSAQNKQEQQSNEGQKPQEGKGKDGKNQNGQSFNDKSQDGKQDGKPTGQDKDGKNGPQPSANSNEKTRQATGQAAAKDDAEHARRDAEASLAKPAANGKNGAGAGDESGSSVALPATAPKSEQQIAQEQWLRSIPDDPGGLLRRKFMIQHMLRQQKAQQ